MNKISFVFQNWIRFVCVLAVLGLVSSHPPESDYQDQSSYSFHLVGKVFVSQGGQEEGPFLKLKDVPQRAPHSFHFFLSSSLKQTATLGSHSNALEKTCISSQAYQENLLLQLCILII